MMRFLLVMLTVLWTAPAHADCSGPAGKRGALMYNDTYDVVQVCTGTNWNALGGGGENFPSGMISAFDLAACPTGWTAYAASSGRFLRGRCLSGEPCNDPDGIRSAGNVQADELKSHSHSFTIGGATLNIWVNRSSIFNTAAGTNFADVAVPSIGNTGGAETRPKNVAVLYCRKD